MRVTPRGEEVRAVIDIMERDLTADQMAKTLIKEVAEMLAMRDWWALAFRFKGEDGGGVNYGPFGSVIEAQKAAEKWIGAGEGMGIKLYSPGQLEGRAEGSKWKGFCSKCGHAGNLHKFKGTGRGECGLDKCKCPLWAEIK